MGRFSASNSNPPFIKATAGVQSDPVVVTATADGTGTGVIPANASIVQAASGNNDHIITLPTYVGGTEILISVGAICELRAPVISGQATSINGTAVDNGSAQTKELALAASTLYRCIAMGSFNWAVTAIAGNGAVSAGGTPN
mgnify:CR=1 FL=1